MIRTDSVFITECLHLNLLLNVIQIIINNHPFDHLCVERVFLLQKTKEDLYGMFFEVFVGDVQQLFCSLVFWMRWKNMMLLLLSEWCTKLWLQSLLHKNDQITSFNHHHPNFNTFQFQLKSRTHCTTLKCNSKRFQVLTSLLKVRKKL